MCNDRENRLVVKWVMGRYKQVVRPQGFAYKAGVGMDHPTDQLSQSKAMGLPVAPSLLSRRAPNLGGETIFSFSFFSLCLSFSTSP